MTQTVSDNWISTVDVGTYKFTFYIVDNDLYNDPSPLAVNDTASLTAGKAVIIAESGVTGAYSIENVMIQSTINPSATGGNTTPTGFVFEIYEPLGFSLLDRVLTVGRRMGRPTNFPSQAYVLKLEFVGRDRETGASKKYDGIFLYQLRIGQMKASLGPAGAKYFIVAQSIIKAAQTSTVTKTDINISEVTTVQDFGQRLQDALNAAEFDLLRPEEQASGFKPNKEYVVKFAPSTSIEIDPITNTKKFDLKIAPWAGTADSQTSSGQSTNMDDTDKRDITVNSETQLTAKVADLIEKNVPSFSTYVEDARKNSFVVPYVYTTVEEELFNDEDSSLNTQRTKIIITIHLGEDFTVPRELSEDQEKLQTNQEVQRVRFAALPIVKKYNYLYTGENTEILDFQLDIEQLFAVAQAPAAGIYYADNNQQFTPTNAIQITTDRKGVTVKTNEQQQQFSGEFFLSDIEIAKINVNESVVYDRIPSSANTQQVNETLTETDRIASHIAGQMARRENDAQQITLEIKGDPFWMGTPDSVRSGNKVSVANFKGTNAMIGFLNYQANEKDLLIDQNRGPVDLISTGIYKVVTIESKFQQGQFTQTLDAYKDRNTNSFLTLDALVNIRIE